MIVSSKSSQSLSNRWLKQAVFNKQSWREKCRGADELTIQLPKNSAELTRALQAPGTLLKDDRTTTVARHELDAEVVVIKRYNPRNYWHKIKRALRQTRADRCWRMSYLFAEAGLNVARPIMMFEERVGPFRQDAFFVNQMLDGEELLSALPKMDDRNRQLVKVELIKAFSAMKKALITHGDMKASNLIWRQDELFFIDLDAAQLHRNRVTWLQSSNKDRKRFLKNWKESPELMSLFDDI